MNSHTTMPCDCDSSICKSSPSDLQPHCGFQTPPPHTSHSHVIMGRGLQLHRLQGQVFPSAGIRAVVGRPDQASSAHQPAINWYVQSLWKQQPSRLALLAFFISVTYCSRALDGYWPMFKNFLFYSIPTLVSALFSDHPVFLTALAETGSCVWVFSVVTVTHTHQAEGWAL